MTESDPEFKTYSLDEVVATIGITEMKHPKRWLTRQIKLGRVTARKVGRSWRMTREDIGELLEGCKNQRPATGDAEPSVRGLSKGSIARRVGSERSLALRVSD